MLIGNHRYKSIDFLRSPRHHIDRRTDPACGGARRSQNQFTPLGDGVNKLIFKRVWLLSS